MGAEKVIECQRESRWRERERGNERKDKEKSLKRTLKQQWKYMKTKKNPISAKVE